MFGKRIRWILTAMLLAAALTVGCGESATEPASPLKALEEAPSRVAAEEGFLSAEQVAATEGPAANASVEADATVTEGEVCHLVDFDDVLCGICEVEDPPASTGITFSDNWLVRDWGPHSV